MTWNAGTTTLICPSCGAPVTMPITIKSVSVTYNPEHPAWDRLVIEFPESITVTHSCAPVMEKHP